MLEQSDIQQVFLQQEACAPEDVVGCAEVFEQPIGIKSLLMVRPTNYPTVPCAASCCGSLLVEPPYLYLYPAPLLVVAAFLPWLVAAA